MIRLIVEAEDPARAAELARLDKRSNKKLGIFLCELFPLSKSAFRCPGRHR